MISYFRSGPGERRRFRSDTRYATHTSDYGRGEDDLRCGRPGPSSGTYTPYLTHLLPRHTSFIMTVIIDYAPTSNPFSLPIALLYARFRSPRPFFAVVVVLVVSRVLILLPFFPLPYRLLLSLVFLALLRTPLSLSCASRENLASTTYYSTTRGLYEVNRAEGWDECCGASSSLFSLSRLFSR